MISSSSNNNLSGFYLAQPAARVSPTTPQVYGSNSPHIDDCGFEGYSLQMRVWRLVMFLADSFPSSPDSKRECRAFAYKTPEDVLRAIKDERILTIALHFTDLTGRWQKVRVPSHVLELQSFDRGIGVSSSAIRLVRQIDRDGMLMIPDPATAFLDPISEQPTLIMICNICDPIVGQRYSADPRSIAQKAEVLSAAY